MHGNNEDKREKGEREGPSLGEREGGIDADERGRKGRCDRVESG